MSFVLLQEKLVINLVKLNKVSLIGGTLFYFERCCMRVISGKARRTALKTLEGMDTRPTTDRIKETLFNMINADIYDCAFLDLFSGSGGIGIEALSRGAGCAVFVENNRKAVECIRDNLEKTRLKDNANVYEMDVLGYIKKANISGDRFDIIFMDPPYNKEIEKDVLYSLSDSSIIDEDTLIIVEASKKTSFDYLDEIGFYVEKRKEYKTNVHMFIRHNK